MLKVWNQQLVPWLFRHNNIQAERYPKLTWLKPGEQNLQSLSQAYQTLAKSGIIDVNDQVIIARVHRQLGLPEPEPRDFPVMPEGMDPTNGDIMPQGEQGQGTPQNGSEVPGNGVDNNGVTGAKR